MEELPQDPFTPDEEKAILSAEILNFYFHEVPSSSLVTAPGTLTPDQVLETLDKLWGGDSWRR